MINKILKPTNNNFFKQIALKQNNKKIINNLIVKFKIE